MLDMLEVWFTNIKRVGIPNYVVVALDEEIANSVNQRIVLVYKRDLDEGINSVARTGGNHAVSGLKFRFFFFQFFFFLPNSIRSIVAFSWVKWMV